MCGRLNLRANPRAVADLFGLAETPELPPRFNIAPSQRVAVIGPKADGSGRGLAMMRWGLIPRWAKDDRGPKPTVARAETAAEKPTFRDALKRRRCLIPVSGFFEWDKFAPRKVPYNFTPADGPLFALAGLWESWVDPATGNKVLTACLITTEPNELVARIHDRMPVILDPTDFAAWLDPATPPVAVAALMRPYPAERMAAVQVSTLVNSPKNDGPECVEPVAAAE